MNTTAMTIEAEIAPSLPDAAAAQMNQDLMEEFNKALDKNPAADLMAIIPNSYRRKHQEAQRRELDSYAAKLNLRTVNELCDRLRNEPEVNLLSIFPRNYARWMGMATQASIELSKKEEEEKHQTPDFRKRLNVAEEATIVFPLSDSVTALLAQHSTLSDGSNDQERSLLLSLRRMLWSSPKLWESPIRGVVVKCNDDILAKVVTGTGDYTVYSTLKYLAEHATDIPAPRPYGLIKFEPFYVIFMSYTSSMTLTEAWPSLSHEEKVSVQHQLDDIFRWLRTLQEEDSHCFGGVGGEGVKSIISVILLTRH